MTNENLLNERVEKIPFHFIFYSIMPGLLSSFIKMPKIPLKKEIVKSRFLFDQYANYSQAPSNFPNHINNKALEKGKDFIYLPQNDADPLFLLIREMKLKYFELPYLFMAKGSKIPQAKDNLFINIRDL